jgi:hypothetical protein
MHYIIVAHGPAVDPDKPVTGGALRANAHETALKQAGHDVTVLRRAQDEPKGFASPADLRRKVKAARPDAIVCVAPEEAWSLRGIAPLCVDLYAPRMLEAAWQGTQSEQAGVAVRAVHAADEVLFSNSRQRWFWLGILGLAGWDLAKPCGRVVPLSCASLPTPTQTAASSAHPFILLGGQRWPWQDASDALRRAVAHLGDRVECRVYGPSSGIPGVREMGTVSRREWLQACSEAVAVLDRYAPHHERELALSFRQLDALSAGTPLITDANTPLAAELGGAGWVEETLEAALDLACGPAGKRARSRVRAVAERYQPSVTEAPLLDWRPVQRVRGESVVEARAALEAARARSLADQLRREAAEAEVLKKRAEVNDLHAQTRALCSAVEASSAALADVAGFRREAVAVLGARLSGADATREALMREVETLRADLSKKNAELDAMTADRDRLQRVFRWKR